MKKKRLIIFARRSRWNSCRIIFASPSTWIRSGRLCAERPLTSLTYGEWYRATRVRLPIDEVVAIIAEPDKEGPFLLRFLAGDPIGWRLRLSYVVLFALDNTGRFKETKFWETSLRFCWRRSSRYFRRLGLSSYGCREARISIYVLPTPKE